MHWSHERQRNKQTSGDKGDNLLTVSARQGHSGGLGVVVVSPSLSSYALLFARLYSFNQGTLPPLKPLQLSQVPLWLAISLKKKHKCSIVSPQWMSVGKEPYHERAEREYFGQTLLQVRTDLTCFFFFFSF